MSVTSFKAELYFKHLLQGLEQNRCSIKKWQGGRMRCNFKVLFYASQALEPGEGTELFFKNVQLSKGNSGQQCPFSGNKVWA